MKNKPAVDIAGHLLNADPAILLDEHGRIVGLPEAIIEQIADRVVEKLKADGSLTPDPRLCGGPF